MMAYLTFLVSCANHREPPKVVSSEQSTNSISADIEAQLQKIGMKNHVGVHVNNHIHMVSLVTDGSLEGIKSMQRTEDSIHKVLGNDFTNYQIMVEIY